MLRVIKVVPQQLRDDWLKPLPWNVV